MESPRGGARNRIVLRFLNFEALGFYSDTEILYGQSSRIITIFDFFFRSMTPCSVVAERDTSCHQVEVNISCFVLT